VTDIQDIIFHVAPVNAGQIVELSYGFAGAGVMRRAIDRSCAPEDPARTTYHFAPWADCEGSMTPWDAPPEVRPDAWQVLELEGEGA